MHQLSPTTPKKTKSANRFQVDVRYSHHSVACHDSSREAARTASEFALEKEPIASWRPLRAIPRCS